MESADELIKQVQQQLMLENFKTLIGNMTPKCFNLCVNKPGLKLSSNEEDCLERCAQSYQQSVGLISSVYMKRISQMQQS